MESNDDLLWLIASLCLTSLEASIILFYCPLPRQVDKEIRDDNRAPKKSHLPNTKSLVPSFDDESLLLSSKRLALDRLNNISLLVDAVLTFSVLALALGVVLYLRWASETLIIVVLVVFLKPRKTPSTVQITFYEDWNLTFTTPMGVESRNSVSNNLKLRFEGLIAPLRANWFPFASPEKPLQSDKLRIIASCVSWENSIRFRY
jgi:hypothetical protein